MDQNLNGLINKWAHFGFSLIWLHPNSKKPVSSGWTSAQRATVKDLIESYRPGYNIGVRTGGSSQLVDGTFLGVIDVDLKGDESKYAEDLYKRLDEISPELRFSAPKVLSGRRGGSCHIYIRTDKPLNSFTLFRAKDRVKVFMPSSPASKTDGITISPEDLKKGYRSRAAYEIDFLSNGKQAVMPPSIHPDTGFAYEWQYIPERLSDLPLIESDKLRPIEIYEPVVLSKEGATFDVAFVDVETDKRIGHELKLKIRDAYGVGTKYPSRSELIFSVISSLVNAGLTDNEIVGYLTNPAYLVSEKALEKGENAAKWLLSQVTKLRKTASAEIVFKEQAIINRHGENLKGEPILETPDLDAWQTDLDRTDKGKIKPTFNNIALILGNLSGSNPFCYHELKATEYYDKEVPWRDKAKGQEITNTDIDNIRALMSKDFSIEVGAEMLNSVISHLSSVNPFNPLKSYLNQLTWDGKPRIDKWLTTYCGARADAYTEAVSSKVLLGAITRALEPGCKFDHVMVLQGDQGIGKSTALAILGGEWFSDTLGDVTNKDTIGNMRGFWIIEIGEMATASRADVNNLKEFLSRQVDRVRAPYARRYMDYPRRCIFIGTTNEAQYLRDDSGNRRFWPIEVSKIDLKKIKQDRDQLWAEAYERYLLEPQKLYLEGEAREIAGLEQESSRIEDPLEQVLIDFKNANPDFFTKPFSLYDLHVKLSGGLMVLGTKFTTTDGVRYSKVLKKLKYVKRHTAQGNLWVLRDSFFDNK